MWRWQNGRAVGGEDVGNAHPLCHRPSGDLQGRCRHDDVAALGCRRDRLELRGDRGFHQLTPALGREWGRRGRWAGGRSLAQLGTDGCDGDAEALDPVAEVGRHAQADLLTERPQLRRQRHQRLDIAPRPDCRQQHAHRNSAYPARLPCPVSHGRTEPCRQWPRSGRRRGSFDAVAQCPERRGPTIRSWTLFASACVCPPADDPATCRAPQVPTRHRVDANRLLRHTRTIR